MSWILLPISLLLVLSQASAYRYIGCYLDAGSRDLPVHAGSGSMSAARCNQLCAGRRYKYFGLQFSKECWCGNRYGKYGRRSNSECSMSCTGRRSEKCGNAWRNSIYATDLSSGRPIRDSMAAKVRSMFAVIPSNVVCSSCLITTFHHKRVGHSSENFPVSELNSRMSRYPAKARNKLRVLQFGVNAKTTFEDSKISIGPSHAKKTTYFGIARRVNNRVHLGMVSADVLATLVQKYKVYKKRVCRKILFWKKCKTHTIKQRRGYHGHEIRQIDAALQSETMRLFMKNLGHVLV